MIKNYLDKFSLENKKVIILGGSGLIGSSVVNLLVSTGAKVLNLDLIDNKNSKKKNYQFAYFNLENLDYLEKNFIKLIKNFGCPDVFINASYPTSKTWKFSSFDKNTFKNLRKNIDLHLNTYVWLSHKICEYMKNNNKYGSVIMMNSIYGLVGQNEFIYKNTTLKMNMNYPVIKGGIISFSRQLSAYYGKYGIRVNTVCAGGIEGHVKGSSKSQSKTFIKNYSKLCPLRRLGKSEEIAYAILFLSSDASSYITGTSFVVDGGWTAI